MDFQLFRLILTVHLMLTNQLRFRTEVLAKFGNARVLICFRKINGPSDKSLRIVYNSFL